MSRQTRLSANDKGDNEMIATAVHRSHDICFTAEENPGKPQLGDRPMKALRPNIASIGVPCLKMRSVELHITSEMEKAYSIRSYLKLI